MIQTRYKIMNFLSITLIMFFFCGLQTSLWHQLTGGAPAPQFWLIILLYLVLYRSYYTALAMSYFLSMILKSFSSISLGILWPLCFLLVTPASYIKSRFFWPSTRYFLFATTLFSISYHIIYLVLSHYLESNPTPLNFFSRIIEILLTILWAAPIYWLLNFADRMTLPEILDTQGARE